MNQGLNQPPGNRPGDPVRQPLEGAAQPAGRGRGSASIVWRAWRLFGTALSFTVFGLGGLILGVLVFPMLFLVLRDVEKRQRFARTLIGAGFGLFVRMMRLLGVLSWEIHGGDRLHGNTHTLIVANHPSLIDVVFLVSFFPQAECVIKRAVTRNWFMRGTVGAANYISNSEPEALLHACTESLRAGSNLILFPEGTRTVEGQPLSFKPGAAAIAVRASAHVLPIVIQCVPPTLRKGEPWYHIPRVKPHWTFEVHPPIEARADVLEDDEMRMAARELNQALLTFYEREMPVE